MLIKALTGREVPLRGLPIGPLCPLVQNVATAAAVLTRCVSGTPPHREGGHRDRGAIRNQKTCLHGSAPKWATSLTNAAGFLGTRKNHHWRAHDGFCPAFYGHSDNQRHVGHHCPVEQSLLHSEEFGPCIRCGSASMCVLWALSRPCSACFPRERVLRTEAKAYRVHDWFRMRVVHLCVPGKTAIVQFVKLTKSLVKP